MKDIRRVIIESLYNPRNGFMKFNWSESCDDMNIDKIFQEILDELDEISIDTSKIRNLRDDRKIIIITTEDHAVDIEKIFSYFGMSLDEKIFETTNIE
jgi:hypothetical protein